MRTSLILFLAVQVLSAPLVTFSPLAKGIKSMAVSEDGHFAFAAHTTDDRVSVWDLQTSHKIVDLTSVAPHFLLSRGQQLFVLGFRTAAIQVYDGPDWTLSSTMSLDTQAPTLLSAPRGPHFQGEILVSAGEYNSRKLLLLDLESKAIHRLPAAGAAAEVGFSGDSFLVQGEFGNSPRSASLHLYSERRAAKLEKGQRNSSGRKRIWQPRPTPFWVDDRHIYNERIERISELGQFIIPDQTRDLVYTIRDGKLQAHRLADGFDLIASRTVADAPEPESQGGGGRLPYQFRPPLAVSSGDFLYLFIYDSKEQTYFRTITEPFVTEEAPKPKPMPIVSAISDGERAHRHTLVAAQKELLVAFDNELKRIAKTGDLDGIDAHQARQAAFEKGRVLPMTPTLYPASAAYQAARKTAHVALTQVYSDSIIALTQALRIDEARSLRDKRDILLAESAAIIDHAQLEGGFCELRMAQDAPSPFHPSADSLIDGKGLSEGFLQTSEGNYLDRNFVLDIVSNGDASISIGNQFTVQLQDQRTLARVGTARAAHDLGRSASAGPHLLRLEKRGQSLLAAWSAEFAGVFVPTGHHLIVDSRNQLPDLNDKNSFLSVTGEVSALRLSLSNEMVTAASQSSTWPQLHGGWHQLANRGGQPSYMRGMPRNLADTQALHGQLRSHTGDYLRHDFIFDAKLFGDSQIQFGDADDSAVLRISGKRVELVQGDQRARTIARLYSDGPHRLRFAKAGDSLTIGVADAPEEPILPLRSIPRLGTALPGLNIHNGFIHAKGNIAALRLAVDDEPVAPPRQPEFSPTTRMEPHAILNPQSKDVGRFAATDLASRDFVFDLQYRFKPHSQSVLQVGLGSAGNSLKARLHGESYQSGAYLALGRPEPLIGKVPSPGPHWIRLSKVGSTLTFAIAVNHGEEFAPFLTRTIPDLATAAPWTEDGLAEILYEGGDDLLAAQLSIEGKPAPRAHSGNTLRVANSAIAIPSQAAIGKRLKAAIVSKGKAKIALISGPDGLEISSSGALSWEPTAEQTGKSTLKLLVTVGGTETQLTAEIAVPAPAPAGE